MSFGECEEHRRKTSLRNPVRAFVIRLLESIIILKRL